MWGLQSHSEMEYVSTLFETKSGDRERERERKMYRGGGGGRMKLKEKS